MIEILIFNHSIKLWELLAVFGVILGALEIFVPGFILLPMGLAFLATAVAAIFLSTWLAVLIALAVNLCFLIWLFQSKLNKFKSSFVVETNVEGMKGAEVIITKKVENSEFGEAKLYGDRWRAYSISKKTYEVGERALVVKVDGNKLVLN